MIEQLAEAAYRFDVHQAISLIERLTPDARSLGDGVNPAREAVRFRSSLASGFPASDLAAARPPVPDRPFWELTANFLGLGGAFGPLPRPFTEAVVWQVRDGDTATRDFLDIFNHRLLSILHRGRRLHRPTLTRGTPDQSPMAGWVYALFGMGTPGLHGRLAVPDRSLLTHAGLLAERVSSAHALERLVRSHFGVATQLVPLQGRWLPLEESETTRIGGPAARNTALGCGAVLGARVWDQQAAAVLELGPLTLAGFRSFLPGGDARGPLLDLVRFQTAGTVAVDVRLRLRADEVPGTRLTGMQRLHLRRPRLGQDTTLTTRPAPDTPQLGWTTWLKTRPREAEGVVTLR